MILTNTRLKSDIAVILSAILVFIAVLQIKFLLAWLCYIPLFIVLQNGTRSSTRNGVLFGAVMGLISFSWMIPGAQRFTGSGTIYGILVFILSTVVLVLYWTVLFTSFSYLRRPGNTMRDALLNAILAGSLWVLGEALLALLSRQMPWFLFRTGMAVSGNLYAIQPVSVLGVGIAGFFVVLVSYLAAYSILEKSYRTLLIPAGLLVAYMTAGFFLLQGFSQQKMTLAPVRTAILTENIPPETRWDESNGNALVGRLLGLARASAQLKPDIAVWTESTVPWTYRSNDDFVTEVLNISRGTNTTQLLGINSDYDSSVVYNSVYSLLPDGKVAGRYDKRYLLGFIEEPVAGIIFPFLSSSGFVVASGSRSIPLQTPYGKAGILVCNESTVAPAAADMVKNGAQFLFNISNDGWFADTYIAVQHFYNARLRAVETRKDMIVNSNDGITGLIKASGEVVSAKRSEEPVVDIASVQPNDIIPPAVTCPGLMLYLCAAGVVFVWISRFLRK